MQLINILKSSIRGKWTPFSLKLIRYFGWLIQIEQEKKEPVHISLIRRTRLFPLFKQKTMNHACFEQHFTRQKWNVARENTLK